MKIRNNNRMKFKLKDTCFYHIPEDIKITSRIAAFDLDWTLAYSVEKLFPKDPHDIYILPNRKEKLKQLVEDGWTLVLFTNQYAMSKKEKERKVGRVSNFLDKIGIPMYAYIATEKDNYRKPENGMFKLFKETQVPTIKDIFYCGDMGGRDIDSGDSDLHFANASKIEFCHPDDYFPKSKIRLPKKKSMVVFIGMPGCGKTTYYTKYLKSNNYIHVNQDTLKTIKNVEKSIEQNMKDNNNICIDATNPNCKKRNVYYELAKKYEYKPTTIFFIRDGRGKNKTREKPVSTIAYHMYFKKLEPPVKENTPGSIYYLG
jgi:bifunctional polynucleotide phosphatase/kinase